MSILEAIKYLLLGIIQGITEVLPISSSGHVEIAKSFFNLQIDEGLLFLILVNTGSLIAFFLVYFRDIISIVKSFVIYIFVPSRRVENKEGFEYALKLVIASIPAAILGFLLSDLIDSLLLEYNVLLTGVGLVFTGTILMLVAQGKIKKGFTQVTYLDAILLGLAQGVAIIPGVSRSGATTSTALKRGMGLDSALRFSFLMYIPVSMGSLLLYFSDLTSSDFNLPGSDYIVYYGLAFLGAAVATFFAFKFIFNVFRTGKLIYFSYYCLIVGVLSMTLYIVRL